MSIVAFARSFHSRATRTIAPKQHFKNCHWGYQPGLNARFMVAIGCHVGYVGPRSRLETAFGLRKRFGEQKQIAKANLPFSLIPCELAHPQNLQCRRILAHMVIKALRSKLQVDTGGSSSRWIDIKLSRYVKMVFPCVIYGKSFMSCLDPFSWNL